MVDEANDVKETYALRFAPYLPFTTLFPRAFELRSQCARSRQWYLAGGFVSEGAALFAAFAKGARLQGRHREKAGGQLYKIAVDAKNALLLLSAGAFVSEGAALFAAFAKGARL
jgi:hypothetical protein